MSTKSRKPRSPATPSRPLGDCVSDVKKLYAEYSHGKFQKAEIASKLGLSAGSGPFAARLFTLKEFGLLEQSGSDYSVSDSFMVLNSSDQADAKFKSAALAAVRKSDVFQELLDEFKTKLPSIEGIATRLENQKRFNADRAKVAAGVLEKSLRYAGVLDNSNNILPIRDTPGGDGAAGASGEDPVHGEDLGVDQKLLSDTLGVEVPVGDGRKVLVRYPHDLSAEEAKKVGAVLAAIVG
jgi:hypothetical protein